MRNKINIEKIDEYEKFLGIAKKYLNNAIVTLQDANTTDSLRDASSQLQSVCNRIEIVSDWIKGYADDLDHGR